MIKKTKLVAGIALIIQSITFLILFFVFYSRKKKSATAYLGISLVAAIAGAAMIIAGLMANGETEIEDIIYIDRGYENVVEKFSMLGADIKRVPIFENKSEMPKQA